MVLYSSPPPLLSFSEVKPTLLVCWWITAFCFTIIVLRIAGRFIRSERLFVEDRTVALAIIPLFLRMGCVHVILTYGTNNAQFDQVDLSPEAVHRRAIGSGLVLASRIFHVATLWILKITILEFFKRLSDALSERFSQVALIFIRCTLAATFVAIIISDLAECHPFSHYWQVLPDPGGQCRQGYAQLLTASVCNVFTDLLLVLFPIPIIFFSQQSLKRKLQLILLFSLSLGVVGVTIYRATRVIQEHGSQQLRSLLASVELLFATTAANALVLGSFVRDRGVKKNKFRVPSVVDSADRSSIVRSRRPTANQYWGSDEDLVRGLGLGVRADLRAAPDSFVGEDVSGGSPSGARSVRPAPILKVGDVENDTENDATKTSTDKGSDKAGEDCSVGDLNSWQFPGRRRSGATNSAQSGQSGLSRFSGQSDDDTLLARDPLSLSSRNNSASTPRRVSFYDAGGLLSGGNDSENDTQQNNTGTGLLSPDAPSSNHSLPPSPAYTASGQGLRRGSTALLQDIGGLLGPPTQRHRQRPDGRSQSHLQTVPQESSFEASHSPPPARSVASPARYNTQSDPDDMMLMDPGGLLSK